MADIILSLSEVSKSFPLGWKRRIPVVKAASFSLRRGDVYTLVGPNGSGKTTITKMIVGLYRRTGGVIRIFNRPYQDQSVRRRIGYLPEICFFPPFLTAAQFLRTVCALYNMSREAARECSAVLLKRVGLDGVSTRIGVYSKGMSKRLGLAQALVGNPELVIMDEPLDGLDPVGVALFRSLMDELKEKKVTVLLTSHLLHEVEQFSDRVGFIKEGTIIKEVTIHDSRRTTTLTDLYLSLMS